MKLTSLRIQQLPGIDRDFTLERLDPCINLVTGPNAIGKSSLIRALRYLVTEPESGDPPALALEAELENGGHWSVSRTGRGYEWRRDGDTVERPPLPERDALHCYWLTMENLVQVGEDDEKLVEQLRQALAGGYDLPALRGGDFEVRPRIGNAESTRLRDAIREQRGVESAYRELRKREATLDDLQVRIDRASRAGTRAANLNEALDLFEILSERELIQAALEEFPPHMDKLRGNELERLEQLEQEHEQRQHEREDAERSRHNAEAALKETGLARARPEQRELEARRRLLDELEHRQRHLDDKREERDRTLAEESRARGSLGGYDEPPQLEPDAITRAETLADELKQLQLQHAETEARLQNMAKAPEESVLTSYRLAIQALLDWLASARGKRKSTGIPWVGIVGVVAAIAAGLAHAWIALGAAVVIVAVSAWRFLQKEVDGTAQARRAFEKQQLDGPAEWDRTSVEMALQDLQQRYDEFRLAQRQALTASDHQERLEKLQRKLDEKEEQKGKLAEEIGFDPSLTALGVDHFVRQVQDYERAAQARRALDETITRLEQEINDSRESVREFLEKWGITVGVNQAELDTTLTDLTERTRRAEEAVAKRDRMDTEVSRLFQDIKEREQRIASLYREAGLTPGDRRSLEDGFERLESWKRQRQRLQENSVRESERRKALDGRPRLIEKAENGERETLERERENAEAEAAGLEDLHNERAQINVDVRTAGGSRQLEKAGVEVDRAKAALEDRMSEQLFAEAGQFLLDEIEREHRAEHEPEVLRDARERFQRFTHYAWDVELDGDRLRARDRKQNRMRELAELSSGTRMQLLLAVRLAWTRHLEQTLEPLPLFLDEALTTADETRFKAVTRSLETLAREEGRQIFYLSARRQEVALWERVTGRSPHHIELASVRRIREEVKPESYDLPEEPQIPEPGEKSAQEYAAELGVPPLAPMHPVATVHLFHLLRDDLLLLHRLLRDWNVTTLGQLEALLESPSAIMAIPDEKQRQTLRGRCRIADAWARSWRRGRGRPVDRIALEESGAVSENFIEEVTELAKDNDGEAQPIIDAMESRTVSGFRTRKIEELQEYLQQNGYMNLEDQLDAAGRERQTLLVAGQYAQPEEIRLVFRWLESSSEA